MRNITINEEISIDVEKVLDELESSEIIEYLRDNNVPLSKILDKFEYSDILDELDSSDIKEYLKDNGAYLSEPTKGAFTREDYTDMAEAFWKGNFDIQLFLNAIGDLGKEKVRKVVMATVETPAVGLIAGEDGLIKIKQTHNAVYPDAVYPGQVVEKERIF
jgi:hypothetical protein